MRGEPRAVLWDFDGTLVDTEPVWQDVQAQMLAEAGVDADALGLHRMVGESAATTAELMAGAMGLEPRVVFDELHRRVCDRLRAGDLPWLPGARELLADLRERGVPCALVTSSNRVIMEAVAEGIPDGFEFIIDGDDVTRSKPDPEPYLMALDRLALGPDEVVVLEDSPPGTASAAAAGLVCVALPKEVPLAEAPRRRIRSGGLDGVTWDELCTIWNEELAS